MEQVLEVGNISNTAIIILPFQASILLPGAMQACRPIPTQEDYSRVREQIISYSEKIGFRIQCPGYSVTSGDVTASVGEERIGFLRIPKESS